MKITYNYGPGNRIVAKLPSSPFPLTVRFPWERDGSNQYYIKNFEDATINNPASPHFQGDKQAAS